MSSCGEEPETQEEPRPAADGVLGDEVAIFHSFEEADEDMRRRRWAMTSLERTQLLEELRRAAHPEEYRNPPTFLEPFEIVPCDWC